MHLSSILACVLAPALASALTINTPSSLKLGSPTNITWVSGSKDWPSWTLFLMGTKDPFDLRQIIQTNVDPKVGYVTTTFPTDRVKVGEPYVVKAVNNTNVDFVQAQSPIFTLTA